MKTIQLVLYLKKLFLTSGKIKIIKSKQNSWIVKVWIAENLFYYLHPFILPDFLKTKPTKYELQIQFKVIQVFTSLDLKKTFYIKQFLDSYSSTLSNQDKTIIKNYFIQLIKVLQEYDLIESNYTIISDGSYHSVQELTSSNI